MTTTKNKKLVLDRPSDLWPDAYDKLAVAIKDEIMFGRLIRAYDREFNGIVPADAKEVYWYFLDTATARIAARLREEAVVMQGRVAEQHRQDAKRWQRLFWLAIVLAVVVFLMSLGLDR